MSCCHSWLASLHGGTAWEEAGEFAVSEGLARTQVLCWAFWESPFPLYRCEE